ncbi:hypothetical protein RRF57_005478 [Xylaria bambusicola]|uniref:Uncharacterized protein n=1 Tax=Xylaria bambusicola TaxID=326684 RepID=A0AAN7UY47_9PEZI
MVLELDVAAKDALRRTQSCTNSFAAEGGFTQAMGGILVVDQFETNKQRPWVEVELLFPSKPKLAYY